jgi:hypothetical protein
MLPHGIDLTVRREDVSTNAIEAGRRAGSAHGYDSDAPLVLQDTNNTVLWLAPHPVVAKVGTRPDSPARLRHEHEVAAAIARASAAAPPPIAMPLAHPIVDQVKGFVVTLWERLERLDVAPSEAEVADSLQRLHAALASYQGAVPSFRDAIDRAQATLFDDAAMHLLHHGDRDRLRNAFVTLTRRVAALSFTERVLHGEPHSFNLIPTPSGIRWIDLEAVCRGPLEWDLAFLGDGAASRFPDTTPDRLALFRIFNSARVATWCWARADHPDMRPHAEHHLGVVLSSTLATT